MMNCSVSKAYVSKAFALLVLIAAIVFGILVFLGGVPRADLAHPLLFLRIFYPVLLVLGIGALVKYLFTSSSCACPCSCKKCD